MESSTSNNNILERYWGKGDELPRSCETESGLTIRPVIASEPFKHISSTDFLRSTWHTSQNFPIVLVHMLLATQKKRVGRKKVEEIKKDIDLNVYVSWYWCGESNSGRAQSYISYRNRRSSSKFCPLAQSQIIITLLISAHPPLYIWDLPRQNK